MTTDAENNKRIAKNTVILYFRMALIMAIALYTSRVVLNTLGEIDYGIYNVIGGVVLMFTFLNGAMAASTSRFITVELGKQDYGQLRKVFNTTLVNHLIIALIILLLAETIGLWFVQNKLVIPPERMSAALTVYQFSIFTCLCTLLQTPFIATIIAHEKMNVYAWASVVDSVLKLAILYLLGIFPVDKLKLYALLMFCETGFMFSFYFIYIKKSFPYCAFLLPKDKKLYKTLFTYSGWALFGDFSALSQGQGLNILLNMFFGPVVNAARGISYQVQGAVTQFSNNIITAVRPPIIKYYARGEIQKMIQLVFNASKYSFLLVFALSLPIFLEMEYILNLWLKEVPEYTPSFTRIIILIVLISAFRTPIITSMHATGKIKIPNVICGSILISTVIFAYIALKMGYGPTSVFIVSLVITFLNMWVELYLIQRLVGYSIPLFIKKVFLISLFIGILSAIVPIIVQNHMESSFFRLIVVGVSSVCSVLLCTYLIGIDHHLREKINQRLLKLFLKFTKH